MFFKWCKSENLIIVKVSLLFNAQNRENKKLKTSECAECIDLDKKFYPLNTSLREEWLKSLFTERTFKLRQSWLQYFCSFLNGVKRKDMYVMFLIADDIYIQGR